MSDLDAFLADVGASQLGWPQSLRWTYDTTRDLLARGVPGDLVECGVAAGAHPAVMARACIDAGETRTVRLFDSFEGVPHGGEHDTEWNAAHGDGSGRLEGTGVAACSQADVMLNLDRWLGKQWVPTVFHRGWFQETVPRDAQRVGPIAFLRLDGDLYESTRVCLEHLYPLVSSGGVVVVDDWNLDGCRAAVLEFLRHTYGVKDYWAAYPIPENRSLQGAVSTKDAPTIIPITESGDVYWVKP